MWLSAEVRWFWRDVCPAETEDWFRRGAGAGAIQPGRGESRVDRYVHARGQTEIGIKVRGGSDDVEVKGLVAILDPSELPQSEVLRFPTQIWCKWTASQIAGGQPVVSRKQRWMRLYRLAGARVEELPLDGSGQTLAPPKFGCNLELTRVEVEGRPQSWWTLGFEAFGDLRTALGALAVTFGFLSANGPVPAFDGDRLSYPEWLDRL